MIFESLCTVKWGDVYKTACNSTIEQTVHHLELKLKVWISHLDSNYIVIVNGGKITKILLLSKCLWA